MAEGDLDGVRRRIRDQGLVNLESLGQNASLGDDGSTRVFLFVEEGSAQVTRKGREQAYGGVGEEVSLDATCLSKGQPHTFRASFIPLTLVQNSLLEARKAWNGIGAVDGELAS